MAVDLIYPEKRALFGAAEVTKFRKLWAEIVDGRDLTDIQEFEVAYFQYLKEVEAEAVACFKGDSTVYSDEVYADIERFKKTALWKKLTIKLIYPYPVTDWLCGQLGIPSFPLLGVDPRMVLVHTTVADDLLKNKLRPSMETVMTDFIVNHAMYWFKASGSKAYRVSSGLQWMLENTELRHYPCNELRLPYPVIYLSLPPKYRIYNDITGWHLSSGMFVVEDNNTVPRCWRLILLAKLNDESADEWDDAIYHWMVHLDDTLTVEDSITKSIEVVREQNKTGSYERDLILKDGTKTTLTSIIPNDGKDEVWFSAFEEMKQTLLPLFQYVMNVVLYATLPDADIQFADASSEYAALRRRALQEKNKRKRKELNSRVNAIGPHPRIILGGSIRVSRETKEAREVGLNEGRKQQVRSLVSGHWHRYWIGPKDEQTLIKKWLKPYWRGPEAAPLTQKEHVLA
jgi:hypothetical protein